VRPDGSTYRLLHRRFEQKPPHATAPWPSQFTLTAPPPLSTSHDEIWGEKKPPTGRTSPEPVGFK